MALAGTRNNIDRDAIIAELRRISVEHEGVRYVRQIDAARCMGVHINNFIYWTKRGYLKPLRLEVGRRFFKRENGRVVKGGAPTGYITLHRLEFLERRLHRLRQYKKWTSIEIDELKELYSSAKNIEQIAIALDRSVTSIQTMAQKLGITAENSLALDRCQTFAKLINRSYKTVYRFCRELEMPHINVKTTNDRKNKRAHIFIDRRKAAHWLINQESIFARLDPSVQQRLRQISDSKQKQGNI